MLAATRELLAGGVTPTVERAAKHAGVSRTTAYRYFPNQRSLLVATYPMVGADSLLNDDAPIDPQERLEIVTRAIGERLLDNEAELRAMLRLSLDPANRAELPLRTGRAIGWIEDALSPLHDTVTERELRRLVLSIRATLGIEAFVWLTDVAGLPRAEAIELMRHSARTLLRAAL
jgi:AcrR family transcriptional regulator